MKKTLLKVLSSTIALTLVATAAIGTAPKKVIPVQEINTRPAHEETVKALTVLDLVEEKAQEENAIEVKTVKAAPAEKATEPEKAAERQAVPEVKLPEAVQEIKTAAPEVKAEEIAAPEVKAEEIAVPEVKAEEIAAPEVKAEEIAVPEENAEPVMVWDVSATEFDDVAMAFYAEPAAAEATDQVEIDVQSGTVYIRGTGAMEEAVYSHFMSTEKYLTAIKALFEDYYGIEVDLVYDESITDVIELDATVRCFAHDTGKQLDLKEEMRQNLDAAAFLEYSPKTIIIEEGITNISDYAFVCCAELETVVLPSTIETIGVCAFEYCVNLNTITIPEDAVISQEAFAYCDNLVNMYLANDDYYNNAMAIHADGENTNLRAMSAEEINALVNYWG